jgi:hypothetical protein
VFALLLTTPVMPPGTLLPSGPPCVTYADVVDAAAVVVPRFGRPAD